MDITVCMYNGIFCRQVSGAAKVPKERSTHIQIVLKTHERQHARRRQVCLRKA